MPPTEIHRMSSPEYDPHGLKELERRRAHGLSMGGTDKLAQQRAKGRLNARERIDALLDVGSFREFGQLTHSDLAATQNKTPADGKIAGFGTIDGRTVYVASDDITVLAGSGGRVGVRKVYETTHYAIEKGYPLIMFGEGGGTRMPDNLGAANHMRTPTLLRGEVRDRKVPSSTASWGRATAAQPGRRPSLTSASR